MSASAHEIEHYKKMTETPVPGLVTRLALPCIVATLITAFYNMADTFFVSQINTSASAAAGVIFTLMAVIQAVGFGFGTVSGSLIAIELGQRNNEKAKSIATTAFFWCVFVGLLVTAAGLIFMDGLVELLGATPSMAGYAEDYARYILIGAAPMAAATTLANQLKSQGNSMLSTIGLSVGGLLNLVLDPLFIFDYGLGLGIAGAAIATVVSQFISFILLFLFANGKKGLTPITPRLFTLSPGMFWRIVRIGAPSFFRQSLSAISSTLLNRAAGTWGKDEAIAAMSIVSRVNYFLMSSMFGFYQGYAAVSGFNLGAGRHDRVKKAFFFALKTAFIAIFCLALLCFIFAPYIISAFRDDPDVVSVGTLALRLQISIAPIMCLTILLNFYYQSSAKSLQTTFLAIARQGLFFIPLILILPNYLGILGVESAQAIADVLTFLFALPLGIAAIRTMNRNIAAMPAQPAEPAFQSPPEEAGDTTI